MHGLGGVGGCGVRHRGRRFALLLMPGVQLHPEIVKHSLLADFIGEYPSLSVVLALRNLHATAYGVLLAHRWRWHHQPYGRAGLLPAVRAAGARAEQDLAAERPAECAAHAGEPIQAQKSSIICTVKASV